MQKCVQIIKYKLSQTEHAINYHTGQEREHSCTQEFPFTPFPITPPPPRLLLC